MKNKHEYSKGGDVSRDKKKKNKYNKYSTSIKNIKHNHVKKDFGRNNYNNNRSTNDENSTSMLICLDYFLMN